MRLNLSNKKYFLLCILLLCLPSNSKNQEYLPFKNNQSFKSEIKIASNENVESVIVDKTVAKGKSEPIITYSKAKSTSVA